MSTVEQEPGRHDHPLRCSPWTRAQGVDPVGSAAVFDAMVLVEWPLPWPRDVSEIPALAEACALPGVRVMTVLPRHDESSDGRLRVVHRRRTTSNHLDGIDHRVRIGEIPDLLASIIADPLADTRGLPSAVGDSPPEVLVCGHGKRDACCGRWGTLMHVELAARWQGTRVSRCSHTGGHRFAPTAITLPDGRAWAYVEPDLLDEVVGRRGDIGRLLAHDRGNSAMEPWAQIVERALFAEHGWSWLDQHVDTAHIEVAADGRSAVVTLGWRSGRATGRVDVARVLPVLVCGEGPESATKTSPEYRLVSLDLEPSAGHPR